jgi:hypothetical protein
VQIRDLFLSRVKRLLFGVLLFKKKKSRVRVSYHLKLLGWDHHGFKNLGGFVTVTRGRESIRAETVRAQGFIPLINKNNNNDNNNIKK